MAPRIARMNLPLRSALRRILLAAITLAAPLVATAAERVKNPLDYTLGQYAFTLGLALFAGLVSWVGKVRAGTIRAWYLMSLVGELSTSALAGLICFWFCEWRDFDPMVTAPLVGIAGHMGTRAIFLMEKAGERMAAKYWGVSVLTTRPAPLDEPPK